MGRRRLAGTLLLAIALVASCSSSGSPAPSTSLRLDGTDSDGGQFELTVVAPAGLVTGGQSLPRPPDSSDVGYALDADGRGLVVWWLGLPCQDRPVIILSDATDAVTIQVENGPRRQGVCPMNEVQFTVLLRLAREFPRAEPAT